MGSRWGVVAGVVWRKAKKMSQKCKKQESFLLSFDLVDRIT